MTKMTAHARNVVMRMMRTIAPVHAKFTRCNDLGQQAQLGQVKHPTKEPRQHQLVQVVTMAA